MKKEIPFIVILAFLNITYILINQSCASSKLPIQTSLDTLTLNPEGLGELLEFRFDRGSSHNHPLMALWLEDTQGNYIQTLYVAKSIGKGEFAHGTASDDKWEPGPVRRPAALPVWSHSRGVQEDDGLFIPTVDTPIPDAYTSATPPSSFLLRTRTDKPLPENFNIYFEINQTWDWNEYWTNNKYPNDENYKTSCQPALVYMGSVSKKMLGQQVIFALIGHSHYSGKDGELNEDISSITTAKSITESVSVRLMQ